MLRHLAVLGFGDIEGMDPQQSTDDFSRSVQQAIFEGLYEWDYFARPTKLSPNTAVGLPEITDGGTTWTIHVKPGILFTDDPAFAGKPRELGYALAHRAYLAAQRGDAIRVRQAGEHAQRIADELDDTALHSTAATAMAIVRLQGGDENARAELLAASSTGLRLRIDELATSAMSNLAHLDVEQGRYALADDTLADALRVSEERDVPICSLWQRGVQARLRLLQGRWPEAEQDALAVLAAGDIPLGRLWAHFVLGLLAVRRTAPEANPYLDELWRLAVRLDLPGILATAAAALAEQVWISRRPDPRLDDADLQ